MKIIRDHRSDIVAETNNDFVKYTEGTSHLVLTLPHSGIHIPGIPHLLNRDDPEVERTIWRGVDFCVPMVTGYAGHKTADYK